MAGYEVAAFKHCLSFLQTGIQDHLVEITPRLSARSLISEDDMDRAVSSGVDSRKGRAIHLLVVLLNRIRIDPHSFNLILEEFDACAMLQVLAKKLREELERVKEEATAPRGDQSDQEEELPTSCGSTDSEEAYTALDMQAPMAVGQSVPGHPAASPLPLHPAARPDILTVKQKIDRLEEEFENNVIQLFAMLTRRAKQLPDFIDVIRATLLAVPLTLSMMHQHGSFFERCGDKLESASTVAKFQSIICSYCNFMNVSLFEYLMKKFGEEVLKAEFRVYKEHLDEFQASTKIGDFIDAQTLNQDRSVLPPEFVKVQMKLGNSWEDRTLKDVQDFHLELCRKASLAPYAVYFISGEWCCIVLTWGMAEVAVSAIFQILDEAGMVAFDLIAVGCDTTAAALESLTVSEQVTPETSPLTQSGMLSPSVWSKQHRASHIDRWSAKVAAKKRLSVQLAQVKDKLHAHCDYRGCSEEELESLAEDLTMEAGVEIHFGQMMAGLSTSVEGEDTKLASELARDCVVYLLLSGPEGSRTLVHRTRDEHYTTLFQVVHGPQRVALVIGDVKLEWDRSNLVIPTQVNVAELAQLCGGDRPSSGIYSMSTTGTEDSPLSPFSFCRQLRLTPGATVSGAIRSLIRLIVCYNISYYYDPLQRNTAQFCADGMLAMKVVSALEIGVHLRDYQTALKQSSSVPSSFDSHASLNAFVGKNRDTIRNQVDIERLLCLYVCFHLGDSGWQCGSCKAGMTCNMAVLEKHVNWQSLLINRFLPHHAST